MVKLKTPEMLPSNGKQAPLPMMHKHQLKVMKTAPTFKEGDTVVCFIARYDNKRYAVFTASFVRVDNYHVFDSEQELHDHFEEL